MTNEREEWLERREDRRDVWVGVVFAFAAVALIAAVVGVGFGVRAVNESKTKLAAAQTAAASGATATAVDMGNATSMVHLTEFKIEPGVVNATTTGGLDVMNTGTMAHNLAVDGKSLATPMIQPGGEAKLDLSALAPGDYTVYCEVAGHRQAGMEAKLHVTAGPAASASSPASGDSGSQPMSSADMDALMAKSTKAFPAKTDGLGAQLLAPKVLPDGTKEFDLTAEVVQWEVAPGKKVEAWTYNGTVPGPTIQVNPGDKVKVVLTNKLPESTVIHFHGIEVPNAMDGVPYITQDPITPGTTYTYSFTAQSTPAVGMYHFHFDAAKQVADGLAGAFLVGSEPVPAGVTVNQQQIMMLDDTGTIGLTLNGKSFPATAPISAKVGDWVEVQYMNEGVMTHPMHLHGLAQTVIAKDGYPVPAPYDADTIPVAPGERYTVLVHTTLPGVWAWHCHILNHAENDSGMFGMVTALIVK